MLKPLLILVVLLHAFSGVTQPNIVFILADDLGYGELGCYGSKDIRTPALDKLISDGIQFKRAYSNSTVCSPSRASILFGDYPDRLGVPGVIRDNPDNTWGNLRDNLVSMPNLFQQQDYNTALIGKWHLGYESPDLPNDRGFDFFRGFVGDMMDDYYSHLRNGINWMRENEKVIDPKGHATDLFTEWSQQYIAEKASSEELFFLFLAYNAPHDPVQPPKEYLAQVQRRFPNVHLKRQKMIAFIEHLDDNIGRLITELKEQGIYEETIIVFTSDNGGALNHGANNDPFNGGKGDMYEGGIRVPCSITWKGELAPDVTHEPFMLMDLYSLLPSLSNRVIATNQGLEAFVKNRNKSMVWVRREGHRFGGQAYYAVSDGKYKLLQNSPFEPFKLFDLENDSTEVSPLGKNGKELLKQLTKHIQQSGKIPWQ